MAKPTAAPLSLSAHQSPGELRLKPKRASSRNCAQYSSGSAGIESSVETATRKSAELQPASPSQPVQRSNSQGSAPPSTTAAMSAASQASSTARKRLLASV